MTPDFQSRRIRFIANFNYCPTKMTSIAYKAGSVHFVKLECAQQAIAKGKAVLFTLPPPSKDQIKEMGSNGKSGRVRRSKNAPVVPKQG